jgi:hypothetical protein
LKLRYAKIHTFFEGIQATAGMKGYETLVGGKPENIPQMFEMRFLIHIDEARLLHNKLNGYRKLKFN